MQNYVIFCIISRFYSIYEKSWFYYFCTPAECFKNQWEINDSGGRWAQEGRNGGIPPFLVKLGEIHQISPNFMEFGEFHGIPPFLVNKRNSGAPPSECFKNQCEIDGFGSHWAQNHQIIAISREFGDFWWISTNFTFSGGKSIFALFANSRAFSCMGTELLRS